MRYKMSEGMANIGEVLKEAMERTPRPKEPEQEPVAEVVMAAKPPNASPAWLPFKIVHASLGWLDSVPVGTKLYTFPPPQRTAAKGEDTKTWVGLTDEEANELWESTDSDWELMKRTEAKLKEKNT